MPNEYHFRRSGRLAAQCHNASEHGSPLRSDDEHVARNLDHCQSCNVNITEIERSTNFRFPSMCPICYQLRGSLRANSQRLQATPILQQQVSPSPSSSRSFGAKGNGNFMGFREAFHGVSPERGPFHAKRQLSSSLSVRAKTEDFTRAFEETPSDIAHEHYIYPSAQEHTPFLTTPAERKVEPSQRHRPTYYVPARSLPRRPASQSYRPVYAVPARRFDRSSSTGVSLRWEHDKFEEHARSEPYIQREAPQPQNKRLKREFSEDGEISDVQQHHMVIGLEVEQLLAEERMKEEARQGI